MNDRDVHVYYVTIVIQQQNEAWRNKSKTEVKRTQVELTGTNVTVLPILCTCANNPASRTQ